MHLYLHVPFCARRCSYCDFAIAVRREVPSVRYADRVLTEWSRRRSEADPGPFATMYFGGGTPSLLEPASLARILERLRDDRGIVPAAEITLETNPDDVTPERARAWQAAGINRISLGVQSFHPAVLAWMHRTHSADDVPRAVAVLRDAGIGNLSLDLIYALPPELARDWALDLDQALALEPDHLSLYGLTVEAHTPLARWVDRGESHAAPEERYAAEFLLAHDRLSAAGFRHYEVSNYGLPGREAVHNSAYWRRAPYLGLGPSAHSAMGRRRWWNLRDWAAWDRAVESGGSSVAGEEVLDDAAVELEDLYLGLRTLAGLPVARLPGTIVGTWSDAGWAETAGDRIRLTAEGWLRLDALVGDAVRARDTGSGRSRNSVARGPLPG